MPPCLWCSQIQTAVPAVSERRLLGAAGDEAWTELQDSQGLAFLLPGSGGGLDPPRGRRSAEAATSKGPHPISGVPESQGRRDSSEPSVR